MDMGMGSGAGSSASLNASGVNFSNETQAFDFLQEILDDSVFGVVGNQYARYFWYGIAVVVGVTTIGNIINMVTLQMRIRASLTNRTCPAKPKNVLTKSLATMTTIFREASYLQITPVTLGSWLKIPPFGAIFIIAGYFGFLFALVFANNDIPGAQNYEALGIRAGWLGAAQVPLLVLLSGKNNLIGLLCNISYERLNIYHRWVSRGLLVLATFHFAFQSHGWNIYGLMQLEWETDACPPTGMAAYAIVLWMNLTTVAPLRHLSYRFFVIQHLLTYFGFTIAIVYHLYGTTSPYSTNYIFISIGLWFLTQLVRIARYTFNNIRPSRATLTPLEGGATKIRISSRQVQTWRPGAYVRLSIPKFGLFISNPATVLSTPTSHNGDLVFILRAYSGFTRRLLVAANTTTTTTTTTTLAATSPPYPPPAPAPAQDNNNDKESGGHIVPSYLSLIDGPYQSSHSNFACFDTVLLVAGATGITFTLSNLLDIAHRAKSQKLPVRVIHFIWVIRKRSWLSWVAEELQTTYDRLHQAGIETHIEIFITCDEILTNFADSSVTGFGREREGGGGGCQCADGCQCCVEKTNTNTNDNSFHQDIISEEEEIGEKNSSKEHRAITTTITTTTLSRKGNSSNSNSNSNDNNKDPSYPSLSCAVLQTGRPVFGSLLRELVCEAEGEVAVTVCGPLGLSVSVRSAVVKVSDELAVHKGSGLQGIYLHVENFN